MNDTNCPNCGASAWHRAGDGIKNYDCGSSSLSAHQSEFCREREARQKAERERDKANQKLKIATEQWEFLIDLSNKLKREIDQLKEQLKSTNRGIERISKTNQFLMSELITARQQRDSAREMLAAVLKNKWGTEIEFIDDHE